MTPDNPLVSAPPKEVPLPRSPLVRVLAQIRFPPIVSIEKRDFIASFQESIREDYAILRPEQTRGMMLVPQGVFPMESQVIWRFSDLDNIWRVSLAPDFLALETTKYVSRDDFVNRLEVVVYALEKHVGPKVVDRLGVRYIDRITGSAVAKISDFVRKEVLGVISAPLSGNAQRVLCESLFQIPSSNSRLLARWGLIPSGETIDPNIIDAIAEPSWILDIDMFCAEQQSFNSERMIKDAKQFSERIYTFFRWAVTDTFLRFYGGSI